MSDTKNKILLVIDLQKQFKDKNGNYKKCIEYIKAHRNEYAVVIGTYFINGDDLMYMKHLGRDDCMDTSKDDLEYPYDRAYRKHTYSANAGGAAYNAMECYLRERGIIGKGPFAHPGSEDYPIYIMGCDSNASVMATAFDLWDKGYDFKILSDYIYTSADEVHIYLIRLKPRPFMGRF